MCACIWKQHKNRWKLTTTQNKRVTTKWDKVGEANASCCTCLTMTVTGVTLRNFNGTLLPFVTETFFDQNEGFIRRRSIKKIYTFSHRYFCTFFYLIHIINHSTNLGNWDLRTESIGVSSVSDSDGFSVGKLEGVITNDLHLSLIRFRSSFKISCLIPFLGVCLFVSEYVF